MCFDYSYAALDARVLLSIAAVLDQQLRDGVEARNQLRRARMRAHAAAVAAAAEAEQDAAAAHVASGDRTAAVAPVSAVQNDNSNSDCRISLVSSVDSHGRRYSANSIDSGSDGDGSGNSQQTDATKMEDERVDAQEELEQTGAERVGQSAPNPEGFVTDPRDGQTSAQQGEQQPPHGMGLFQGQLEKAQLQHTTVTEDVGICELPTATHKIDESMELELAETGLDQQTIEVACPGLHCYLPWGKEFTS